MARAAGKLQDGDSPIGRNKMPAHVRALFKPGQLVLPGKQLAMTYLGMLPKDAKGRHGLKPIEDHILLRLLGALDYTGKGFKSQRALSEETGRVRREVGKAIALGNELGLVEVVQKGRHNGAASTYQWRWPAEPVTAAAIARARERLCGDGTAESGHGAADVANEADAAPGDVHVGAPDVTQTDAPPLPAESQPATDAPRRWMTLDDLDDQDVQEQLEDWEREQERAIEAPRGDETAADAAA